MKILYRKKTIVEINNTDDLNEFIKENNFFKFFIKIPDEFINEITSKITQTEKLNFKEFKPWYRKILNYPMSVYEPRFLYCMGWDEDDINRYISETQKNNSMIVSINKKNNPEKYYESTSTRKEYWMKKGFSEEEAKNIISKRQSTFSREKCIEKYGYEKGIIIFNERQKKWINSLVSNNDMTSIHKRQNSYDYSKDINSLVKRTTFNEITKQIIIEGFLFDDISKFVDYVINKIDIKTVQDILAYVNSRLVQHRYNVNHSIIKKIFYDKISGILHNGYYGNMIYDNGIRYKSVKEYKLSQFLKRNNIKFDYEKRYPDSRFISDFYLPEYDIYIEYYGMLDGKNIDKLDENQKRYYLKMIEKNEECEKNQINLIHDTNFNKLYKKIENLINYGNKD
jgi:hypothetical protein